MITDYTYSSRWSQKLKNKLLLLFAYLVYSVLIISSLEKTFYNHVKIISKFAVVRQQSKLFARPSSSLPSFGANEITKSFFNETIYERIKLELTVWKMPQASRLLSWPQIEWNRRTVQPGSNSDLLCPGHNVVWIFWLKTQKGGCNRSISSVKPRLCKKLSWTSAVLTESKSCKAKFEWVVVLKIIDWLKKN